MKKSILLSFFVLYSLLQAAASVQMTDLLIIKGDTIPLCEAPLVTYLMDRDMAPDDIPGFKKEFSTRLARGYRCLWEVADNRIYLVKIFGTKKRNIADLHAMFGAKYKNGRVFANWIDGKLIAQHGKEMYHDPFVGAIYEYEKRITVTKGWVMRVEDYPTLNGKNNPWMIRIWDGNEIDTRPVGVKLTDLLTRNFTWTPGMRHNASLEIMVIVNDDFTVSALTENEYRLKSSQKMLDALKKERDYYQKRVWHQYDARQLAEIEQGIKESTVFIESHQKEVAKECEEAGVYLHELKRVLEKAEVETLIYRDEPYLSIPFSRVISFNAKNKTFKLTRRE